MFKSSFLPCNLTSMLNSVISESRQQVSCQRSKSPVRTCEQGLLMPNRKQKDTKKLPANFKGCFQQCKDVKNTISLIVWNLFKDRVRKQVSTWLTRRIRRQVQINSRITRKLLLVKLSSTSENISRHRLQRTSHQGGFNGFKTFKWNFWNGQVKVPISTPLRTYEWNSRKG